MLIVVITGRVEMEGLAKIFFKKWGYYLTLILLIISLQATIISSVIISAQTADQALVAMFSYSCGLEFYPDFGYESVSSLEDSNLLFADMVIISLGFVLVFACTLPMAYFNLDDNILIQIGVCLSMLVIVFGVWMVDFFLVGLDFERVSMIGPKQGTTAQEIARDCHI
jgi:hypothetical protein